MGPPAEQASVHEQGNPQDAVASGCDDHILTYATALGHAPIARPRG